MNTNSMRDLREAMSRGERFAMCTVVRSMGSSPGSEGQKMFVFTDGSTLGTVGGGVNEEKTRQKALHQLVEGGSLMLGFDMAKGTDPGDPICGGNMEVFIEVIQDSPRMVVFGGGHIGKVVTRLAAVAGFRVTLVDDRPEVAEECRFPEVDRVLCCPYEESVAKAGIEADTAVIIVTPGHAKDREVLDRAVKTPAKYIGMIGSAKKVKETKARLVAEGADPKRMDGVFSPIGINLGGDSPEEIAVSILAQVVAFRNGKTIPFIRNQDA